MSIVAPYNLERIVKDFWNPTPMGYSTYSYTNTTLDDDYFQTSTNEEYIIEAPLVGIAKEKLKVHVEDNLLVVSAEVEKKTNYVKSFKRSWNLNKDCDAERITATLENGLLTVKIPKIKPAKRTVNVNVV